VSSGEQGDGGDSVLVDKVGKSTCVDEEGLSTKTEGEDEDEFEDGRFELGWCMSSSGS
jgi:hypothetical protein